MFLLLLISLFLYLTLEYNMHTRVAQTIHEIIIYVILLVFYNIFATPYILPLLDVIA